MVETLQFQVMFEGDVDRAAIQAALLRSFPGSVERKSNSVDLRRNWVEIWPNEDADPQLAATDEDGYLYYRWQVDVTPLDDELGEDWQVQVAREMVACLTQLGGDAVVLANFEDRV